jgi:hypothetical protein
LIWQAAEQNIAPDRSALLVSGNTKVLQVSSAGEIGYSVSSGGQSMRFRWYSTNIAIIWAAGLILGLSSVAKSTEPKDKTSPGLPEVVLKQTKPIFDGKSLDGWVQIPADSWEVKEGAMASRGAGRGVIYTMEDYSKYRLVFTMRHV